MTLKESLKELALACDLLNLHLPNGQLVSERIHVIISIYLNNPIPIKENVSRETTKGTNVRHNITAKATIEFKPITPTILGTTFTTKEWNEEGTPI